MKAKRLLTFFVAVFTALTLTVSFVACGSDDKGGCKHSWTSATCTEPARCTLCNATKGKAAGHKYVDNNTAATCEQDGRNEKECSVCHDKTSVVVPKLTHKYTSKVTAALACETDEVTTYTCKLCDDVYSETTKRHAGHDTDGIKWEYASESLANGSRCEYIVTEKAKCKTCKEDIERTYHKHVYKPVIVDVTPATCKVKGAIQYECDCGDPKYSYTEEIAVNPAAHEWGPTTKAGYTHECGVCKATKSEITVEGNRVTIEKYRLIGKSNISITTGNGVTLAPDNKLAGTMGLTRDGIEIAAEAAEMPSTVTGDDAEILDGATVYNFELNKADGSKIDFGTSKMTVSVPYYEYEADEDPASVYACYIADDGKVEYLPAVYGNGAATFEAAHFSHYTVVRLTPEQRCAKLGHNNVETVVAATCTQDGYTAVSCKRCGAFDRKAETKKTGHKYAATNIAATCTERGYTLMACENDGCDETYVTKYVAAIPHSYTDKNVNATCSAKGYTEHTCNNCGSSYRDNYTDMVAHKYVKGVCSVCGKKSDVSAADNYYINFINSIVKIDNYYVDLSDADIKIVTESKKDTETDTIVVNAYRLSVALDKDGYLVGSGEGKVKVTTEHINRAPWVSDQNVLLAFKDKKIYTYIANTFSEGGAKRVYSEYSVTSQDDAGLGYIKQYVEMFYGESVKKVVGILLDSNTKNSPINAGIAKVMDFLFDRKASASGYTLMLNYDNAAKAVEYANTHTAAEVIDAIIGEGKFNSIVEFMKDFPEMTLDEFIFKAKGIADEFGLSINDFYAIIDSVFKSIDEDSKVNTLDYVSKNGSKKMSAIVEELSGGKMSADSIKSIISNIVAEYVPILKNAELSFIKLLASYVPVKDKDFDLAGYIKTSLDALNASAKNKIGVVIKTDSSGAFESVAVNANGFEHTQNVPAAVAREEATIKVSGKLSFVITTVQGAISNNINIVTATEKAKADFEAIVKKNVGKVVDSERGNRNYTFTIITKDGKYAYVPNIDAAYASKYLYSMPLVQENFNYNGTVCSVYSLSMWSDGYVFDFDGDYSYRTSCTGWIENSVSTTYLHEQYFNVYRNGNNILGVEFDWEKSLEDTWSDYHMEVYSNAAQGKLSFSDPHKYVLINKSEDPTKCEQTVYDTYRCTACGQLRYDYRTKWHDYEYTYELKSGAKDCSGGVVMVGKCKDCGDTDRYEYDGIGYDGKHRTFNYEYSVKGAACEDTVVTVVRCVCGSYVRDVYVGGNGPDACEFDHREVGCGETDCKYYRHYVYEHQCYLSECGYTYKSEHIETMPDKNCMSKSWEVITLKDGTKYTTTAVENVMHQITSDTTKEGELSVHKYTCSNCKTLFSLEKFDKYGREVYYYSYERKSGWEIVIDKNCNYVRYTLDSEGKRGEQTGSGVDHVVSTVSTEDKKNCTQPHERVRSCAACGLKTTVNYFYGHEFKYDYEAGIYKCVDCGMTNDNWAEAPIRLEDLNKGKYTDGNIKIGYHAACRIKADIELYTDYDYGYGNFVEIEYNEEATSEESGIITIAKDDVMQLLEGGAQSFTVVFTINRVFNYGGYEYRTYEVAITFTIEELVTILGLNA